MDVAWGHVALVLLTALLAAVGIIGAVLPFLPGIAMTWLGVVLWAVLSPGDVHWGLIGIATALLVAGTVTKFLWPTRQLQQAGIPGRNIIVAGLAAIAGFFFIPFVGIFVGFVAGLWAVEFLRLQDVAASWASAWAGLKAVGWSMVIDLAAGFGMVIAWIWVLWQG